MTDTKEQLSLRLCHYADYFFVTAAVSLYAAWLTGQIFRDQNLLTAYCFYIPSPCTAGLFLVIVLYSWRKRYRRICVISLILLALPSLFVIGVENRWTPPDEAHGADKPLRLLHWNIRWGRDGWEGIAAELRKHKADICILSEVPYQDSEGKHYTYLPLKATGRDFAIRNIADRLGSGYTASRIDTMAIFARGELENGRWFAKNKGFIGYSVIWNYQGKKLNLFAVDMPSGIFVERDPLLRKIVSWIERDKADIAVGDFNAPRRSKALSPLPEGFVHAYDAAGLGWSYTWPVPCPVYAIDQCILGTRIVPLQYSLNSTGYSDHRHQVLDFYIKEQ